ncbi:gastrula zinc finger protein XlCGF7.1-like [Pimephales promelas]|nr:gastrula zinc finger protein XlCGF7.1-like [Pimephales promelas]
MPLFAQIRQKKAVSKHTKLLVKQLRSTYTVIKMALIKEESEEFRIEEVFTVKQEDTEEQTGLMPLKEESEALNQMKEKDQFEKHDFMAAGNSKQTENTSTQKRVQKTDPNSCFTCFRCDESFNQQKALRVHMAHENSYRREALHLQTVWKEL